ncbi:hypothetical protein T492DRAFT_900634 [Pavlovales sp. CCMP2436]|nr:hypothetical protein T492DRAFT_900634 [Pavlovales sp. CCMP2436]
METETEEVEGKATENVGFESNAFETLERDFQEVLTELVGDKSLERFRLEYEKLHRALKKSHESEKRLIKKCRELNSEIVSNAAKVQTALKLSQEDQNTIVSLKREIEKAWKMVDASHEKEARAKETIQQLKTEIQNLSRLVEQGAGLSMGQEAAVNELLRAKEELTAERDTQMMRIIDLRVEIGNYLEKMQRLDQEVRDIRLLTDTRTAELKAKSDSLLKLSDKLGMLEANLRAQKLMTDAAVKQVDGARVKGAKVGQEIEEKMIQIAALRAENVKQQEELKRRDLEADQCRQEIQRRTKDRDAALKRNKELGEAKIDVTRQRDGLRAAIASIEREISLEKSEHEQDKRAIVDLERERAAIGGALRRADGETGKQIDLVKLNEFVELSGILRPLPSAPPPPLKVMVSELEEEIGAYKLEALRQKKTGYSLEQERVKYAEEASDVNSRFARVVEDVKLREMAMIDLQKKISDSEGRLKGQQKLYEAVRSDRNLYSKNLIEAQDEIAEMKRKFKIMNHQIEQLKEEITAKEAAHIKEHFEHAKAEKEREAYKGDLARVKRAIGYSEGAISSFRKEITKLNAIINEADGARLKQKVQYDLIITERDILGTQLIRRNDELSLLYEKLRVQQLTLSSGERLFAARVDDTHLLKLAINNTTRELHIAKRQGSNLEHMREEVYDMQRELLQERTKVKALSEELENPANPHRWRRLSGADPSAYEMVHKIQSLQKRLRSWRRICSRRRRTSSTPSSRRFSRGSRGPRWRSSSRSTSNRCARRPSR